MTLNHALINSGESESAAIFDSRNAEGKIQNQADFPHELLNTYANCIDASQSIDLLGQLHHTHASAQMRAVYALSKSGEYGYAFLEDVNPHMASIGQNISTIVDGYSSVSCKLAAIDSVWLTATKPIVCSQLAGNTVVERDSLRSRLVGDEILRLAKAASVGRVFMIGYFEKIIKYLWAHGIRTEYADSGRGITFPLHLDLNEAMKESIFVSSASYIVRNDRNTVEKFARLAKGSLVIAQTGHNLMEYYFDRGFSVVCSESFPPFSLSVSSLKIFRI